MRAILPLATVWLVAVAHDEPRRYIVVPTSVLADTGTRPCPPSLSDDGALVAFEAHVPLDPADQNGRPDIYLVERTTNRVTLLSRNLTGGTGRGSSRCPHVSGDGQRVIFESDVTDLVAGNPPGTVDVFLFEKRSGTLRRIAPMTGAVVTVSARPALSADGHVLVFNATRDQRTHVYRASLDMHGDVEDLGEGHSVTVSGDGRVVAFVTSVHPGAPQVIRVVAADMARIVRPPAGQMADDDVFAPALSADGQWIAYVSRRSATRGSGGRTAPAQVFVERVGDGFRYLVSTTPQGREANGYSKLPAIDATGSRVVFESTATDLGCNARGLPSCDEDINLLGDIFLWQRASGAVTRVNTVTPELPWLEGAAYPAVSPDGRQIAFLSRQPVSGADGRDTFDLFITRQ
jgi:Tol biopolymer transport system component